jgi:hypothetical protein
VADKTKFLDVFDKSCVSRINSLIKEKKYFLSTHVGE